MSPLMSLHRLSSWFFRVKMTNYVPYRSPITKSRFLGSIFFLRTNTCRHPSFTGCLWRHWSSNINIFMNFSLRWYVSFKSHPVHNWESPMFLIIKNQTHILEHRENGEGGVKNFWKEGIVEMKSTLITIPTFKSMHWIPLRLLFVHSSHPFLSNFHFFNQKFFTPLGI